MLLVLYKHCVVSLSVTGCCFVTFYTRKAALDAQNALHNIKTLPGVSTFFGNKLLMFRNDNGSVEMSPPVSLTNGTEYSFVLWFSASIAAAMGSMTLEFTLLLFLLLSAGGFPFACDDLVRASCCPLVKLVSCFLWLSFFSCVYVKELLVKFLMLVYFTHSCQVLVLCRLVANGGKAEKIEEPGRWNTSMSVGGSTVGISSFGCFSYRIKGTTKRGTAAQHIHTKQWVPAA